MSRVVLRVGLALGGLGVLGAAPVEPGESLLQVVTVAGRAETQPSGASTWTAARLHAELGPGAAARTLQGRLTLMTPAGQALRLAGQSRVSVLEAGAPDQPTAMRLDAGSVWVAAKPGSAAGEHLELRTAAVAVVVGGSGVEVTLGRDGVTLVRVYHGEAVCSGPGIERRWTRTLRDGQELLVPDGNQPGEVRKVDRGTVNSEWVKWNEDQDLAGGYGSRPPEK